MPLEIGKQYTRIEVQKEIGVVAPSHQGKWGTGYTEHEDEFFVFANVGGPGRTGHDYPNEWIGDVLHWCAKGRTTLDQPEIRRLLKPGRRCHIFTRHNDRAPFTYHGAGTPTEPRGAYPVKIAWRFDDRGTVTKGDLAAPRSWPLHAEYRIASTTRQTKTASDEALLLRRNLALVERAVDAHARTQDALAARIRSLGYAPTSPCGPIDYDLAWREATGTAIAEVKSLTDANQATQIRLGLGQLLDYATAMEARGEVVSCLILAVEFEPSSSAHWRRTCQRAGVHLCWAPDFEGVGR